VNQGDNLRDAHEKRIDGSVKKMRSSTKEAGARVRAGKTQNPAMRAFTERSAADGVAIKRRGEELANEIMERIPREKYKVLSAAIGAAAGVTDPTERAKILAKAKARAARVEQHLKAQATRLARKGWEGDNDATRKMHELKEANDERADAIEKLDDDPAKAVEAVKDAHGGVMQNEIDRGKEGMERDAALDGVGNQAAEERYDEEKARLDAERAAALAALEAEYAARLAQLRVEAKKAEALVKKGGGAAELNKQLGAIDAQSEELEESELALVHGADAQMGKGMSKALAELRSLGKKALAELDAKVAAARESIRARGGTMREQIDKLGGAAADFAREQQESVSTKANAGAADALLQLEDEAKAGLEDRDRMVGGSDNRREAAMRRLDIAAGNMRVADSPEAMLANETQTEVEELLDRPNLSAKDRVRARHLITTLPPAVKARVERALGAEALEKLGAH
jgi:hypothetical protein